MRIALIQTTTPQRPEQAFLHILPLINQAMAQKPSLVVLPEAANRIDCNKDMALNGLFWENDDPFISQIKAVSRHFSCPILIGSAIVRSEIDPSKQANRSIFIGPDGEIKARYDKIHLFDATTPDGRIYRESVTVRAGDQAVCFRSHLNGQSVNLGLSICYDVRFSELYRHLALTDAMIIFVPAAFTVPTGKAHWEVLLRARAIETGAFIVAPAQGGTHQDGRSTYGHSMVISPWGEIIAKLDHDRLDVLMAELDLNLVLKARQSLPQLQAARAFHHPQVRESV